MSGICVAVKATTRTSSRPRKATLKLWKSRPAAPAIRTLRIRRQSPRFAPPPRRDRARRQRPRRGARPPSALAFAPELAQERARLAPREPGAAELLAQEGAEEGLEGPRPQVARRVEAGVDVGEEVDVGDSIFSASCSARRSGRASTRARSRRGARARRGACRVAADEVELAGRRLGGELLRPREVEASLEPDGAR